MKSWYFRNDPGGGNKIRLKEIHSVRRMWENITRSNTRAIRVLEKRQKNI